MLTGIPSKMQHMGQPGMFAQYPGNGGVFMGNPMMQGTPFPPLFPAGTTTDLGAHPQECRTIRP